MLEVTEKKLRAELKRAQQDLELMPGTWSGLEAVGRCLHWLQDPAASDYLRRAAEAYPLKQEYALGYIITGNHYRLAGEAARARSTFERAEVLLRPGAGKGLQQLVEVSFLLDKFQQVEPLVGQLRAMGKPGLRAFPIGKLAGAHLSGDPALAAQATEELAAMIKRGRARISDTGPPTLWD